MSTSDHNLAWNRAAVDLAERERLWFREAVQAGFSLSQAIFMWNFMVTKHPDTPQDYDTLRTEKSRSTP